MELALTVLTGFAAAVLAPAISARSPKAHWLLALAPLCLTIYFLSQIPSIREGESVTAAYEWVPALGIDFSFRLDGLSLLFATLISGIGTVVVLYSGAYLAGRPYLGRFYAILLVFMASMLGLVLADDLILLFVFWELTSISSYGLISIESERAASRAAALQALLVTAGGGLALMAGFVLLNVATGTQSVSEITQAGQAALGGHRFYDAIVILVLAGAFTKSAQFPFHFWLPNAMEAPTPVSAYLHSATMVKAGIYLLARFTPALGGSDLWFYAVTAAGAITMLLGSALALRETDLKRILAYVTVSILGALTMLIGVGTEEALLAALGLLFAHALYKACLFLVAGIVDHEAGTREIAALGGLARHLPVTAGCALLAAASMAGIPLWFGFIAKELSYEALLHSPDLSAIITGAAVAANALMVAVAIVVGVRPFWTGRLAQEHGHGGGHNRHLHDPGAAFLAGPVILAGLGLLMGVAPSIAGTNLVVPAAASAFGHPIEAKLAIWHGVNQALLLSLLTFLLGAVTYLARSQIRASMRWATVLTKMVSPEQAYERSVVGLNVLATGQTRILQNGYLRVYIATIFVALTALVLSTLALKSRASVPDETSELLAYEVLIGVVILGGALLAVTARSRLSAAVSLGMVGYGVGLIYVLFGAPDLAMTQILVETLVVLLFVFAFAKLPRFGDFSSAGTRVRDAAIALASGAMVTILLLTTLSTPRDQTLSAMLAEASKPLAHGSNVVNVILVDFRALDTLGEITVLGIAAIGILALFRRSTRSGGRQ